MSIATTIQQFADAAHEMTGKVCAHIGTYARRAAMALTVVAAAAAMAGCAQVYDPGIGGYRNATFGEEFSMAQQRRGMNQSSIVGPSWNPYPGSPYRIEGSTGNWILDPNAPTFYATGPNSGCGQFIQRMENGYTKKESGCYQADRRGNLHRTGPFNPILGR